MAQSNKELGGRKLSLPVKIVIVIFAIMMALSMMLPSLAQFFAGQNAQTEQTTEETDDQTTETDGTEGTDETEASEASDETEATDAAEATEGDTAEEDATDDAERAAIPNNDTLKKYYDTYKPEVTRYEKKLQENPDNLAALLNAGKGYMNWGYAADYASTNEEEHAYSYGIVSKAVELFDRYLALNDAKSVHVDKAMCLYYMDKTDEAIAELEAYSEVEPDYPLIWANLGMLYELMGKTEKANEAYATAIKTDPDNSYGAKTYAASRQIELNATNNGPADFGEADAKNLQTDDGTESGLAATLAQDTGVGF